MPLKIVGAAYPRTGTVSLKLALEQLGFGPCHHMSELIQHPENGSLWIAAAKGQPDWDAVFADFSSCVDAPSCYYWRELAAKYPDAKVILTDRDPEAWFSSVHSTVFSPEWVAQTLKMPLGPFFQSFYDFYDGKIQDHDFMIATYRRYCEDVKRAIAPDRLLVFRTGDGWAPLCRFLGVAVPDAPYPKANTREEMRAMIDRVIGGSALAPSEVIDNLRGGTARS
jgi:hypothetical protein